jgi:hypothetical protein
MDMVALGKLQCLGGPKLEEFQRLLAESDRALHDSPASLAYAAFCKSWEREVAQEAAAAAAARAG